MENQFNRKKTRKLLFQKLYAQCFNHHDEALFEESFIQDVFTFSIDRDYLNKMQKVITYNEAFFIKIIKMYSPRFSVSSMSLSFTIPVYVALAEMFFLEEEIPAKVSVNEGVEIAKVYGDDSSKKIVNGVLNKVLVNLEELIIESKKPTENIDESIFQKTS